MRVLVVEKTSAEQAITARRLESIERVDKDTLDLSIGLADERSVFDRLSACDVVFLGASLGEGALEITRQAKNLAPQLHVIMLMANDAYVSGAFRSALTRGARKVFSENAPLLDIVQELMSIHEEFRSCGSIRSSRVIAVVQAKGGVGATSTCAALAEACATYDQTSLLWDLDIETRDLCRAFAVEGDQPSLVRQFINGEREISRESLRQALMPITNRIDILPPPDHVAASVDLVGRVESIEIVQSIINLARITHDNVIIDLGGRLGPAAGAIMRSADAVVVLVDDSLLGLSAARFFVPTLRSVIKDPDSLYFLCSGISVAKNELAKHIEDDAQLGEHAWTLPIIPFDANAAAWPGTGQTLYSIGGKKTRQAFNDLAAALELIDVKEKTLESSRITSSILHTSAYTASTAASILGFLSFFKLFWQRVLQS